MSWQLLTIISVLTFSVSVLLQRVLLHTHKVDPFAYVVVFQGFTGCIVGALALLNGFSFPDVTLWPAMLATFMCYGIGHVAYAKTLQRVEASVFPTLFATQVVWVMAIGVVFFQERPPIWPLIGSVLVFASIILLANTSKESSKYKLNSGVLWGLLTGLLFGIASATWAYVGRQSDTLSWAALGFLGPALLLLLAKPRTLLKLPHFLNKELLIKVCLLCSIFSVSGVTLLQAYRLGELSLVAPLRQTAIVVTFILAVLFLRERDNLWRKIVASAVCFLGVLLLI